jgi:protein involved in polysaccharide export with SLBB domain
MRDRLIHCINLAVSLLALSVGATAQDNVRRAEAVRPGLSYESPARTMGGLTQRAFLVDPNKRLGVGDQVAIEIVEDREGPTSRIITATGDLEVPPLDRVHVAGKTTAEAAAEIKRLLLQDYYYTVTVKLSIDQVNVAAALGKVQIAGEVVIPGNLDFNLADPLTLSEAILKAGNFKDFADPKKVKVVRTKGGVKKEFVIDVKSIMREGAADKDITLEDGDRVFVPKVFIRWN